MTAPQEVASTAKDAATQVMGTSTEQASQVAAAAGSAAGDIASTARTEAANAVGEGLDQARDLLGTAREQVAEQISGQGQRMTEGLRGLSTQLRNGDTSGVVGQVLQEAGSRVSALADYAERTGPEGIVNDLRSYARRNPGTFLLGAALAGLVGGRVVKGISAGKQPEGTGVTSGYAPTPAPAEGYVAEPVAYPTEQTAPYGTPLSATYTTGGTA